MITAVQVKELREITGAGMMECKKALSEANGDIGIACRILRERGCDIVRKKANRETGEGIIVRSGGDGENRVTFVEIRCETDFVSRNPVYADKAKAIAETVHARGYGDLSQIVSDDEINDMVEDVIVTFGENVRIASIHVLEGARVFAYVHSNGKLAAAVALDGEGALSGIGHDLAMQICATDPIVIEPADMPEDAIDMNRAIFEKQAANEGKPAEIASRIVEGKMNKFLKESSLMTQAYVKDPSKTVGAYIEEVASGVVTEGFVRVEAR